MSPQEPKIDKISTEVPCPDLARLKLCRRTTLEGSRAAEKKAKILHSETSLLGVVALV